MSKYSSEFKLKIVNYYLSNKVSFNGITIAKSLQWRLLAFNKLHILFALVPLFYQLFLELLAFFSY